MARRTFLEDSGSCAWFARYFFGGPNVSFAGGNVEEHEPDLVYMYGGRQSFDDGANCDFRRLVNRIAERAGRYRREGQGLYSVIVGDADAFPIATGERFGLVLVASSIDWADGVNYVFGG